MEQDIVVLVDEDNRVIGTFPKSQVHSSHTPLHRGFSVFLFDSNGRILLQQRSRFKKTWPLVWSGSCCGHPNLNETVVAAARRRVLHELGISSIHELQVIIPNFRYKVERDGIVENEICPILVGRIATQPVENPTEVENLQWKIWGEFAEEIVARPQDYSDWCVYQVKELGNSTAFQDYYTQIFASGVQSQEVQETGAKSMSI